MTHIVTSLLLSGCLLSGQIIRTEQTYDAAETPKYPLANTLLQGYAKIVGKYGAIYPGIMCYKKIYGVHVFGRESASHSFDILFTEEGKKLHEDLKVAARNNPDKVKRASRTSNTIEDEHYYSDEMVRCAFHININREDKTAVAHCVTEGTTAFDYFNFQMAKIREQYDKKQYEASAPRGEELVTLPTI